jgi:CheY-specific phosphatase CheX
MGVKFFGQFLLESNVITAGQLLEAVKYQESRNLKFGDYARSRGYLAEGDVGRLREEQKRTDMMIGELAVELGMLDNGQVDEILTMQKNDHIFIGEALVRRGFITTETLEKELERFGEDQKRYVPGEINVSEGVKDPDAVKSFVDLTLKMLRRMAHVDVKVEEGFISESEPGKNFSVVSVLLSGAKGCEYVLSVSREVALRVATGVMGQDAGSEPDEIVSDGVKEFCNIVCGNIVAGMAKKGMTVEISPPSEAVPRSGGYKIVNGRKAVHYPLVSTKGEILLIIIEG